MTTATTVTTNVTMFPDDTVSVSVVTNAGQMRREQATAIADANLIEVAGLSFSLEYDNTTTVHGSDIYYFRGRKHT